MQNEISQAYLNSNCAVVYVIGHRMLKDALGIVVAFSGIVTMTTSLMIYHVGKLFVNPK
jgi:hypothetical protein